MISKEDVLNKAKELGMGEHTVNALDFILAERDAAVRLKNAYREVAIKFAKELVEYTATDEINIDAEAQKILESKG